MLHGKRRENLEMIKRKVKNMVDLSNISFRAFPHRTENLFFHTFDIVVFIRFSEGFSKLYKRLKYLKNCAEIYVA
jgi:hypothetical protein